MPDDDGDVMALVHQLTAYLRDNPLACDTQEGIARWWLAPGTACDDETLSRALQRMLQHRLIESLSAVDGRVRYRRIAAPTGSGDGTKIG
jgi:hypothetical protein